MKNQPVFNLFANCILQNGYNSYIICDLQRQKIKHIPKTLFYILRRYKAKPVEEIKKIFDNKYNEAIDEYFKFLYESEFGFYCSVNELKLFPALDLSFDHPALITNAIIDINRKSPFELHFVFSQLEKLHCRHLQLRLMDNYPSAEIMKIAGMFKKYSFRSVELVLQYTPGIDTRTILKLYSLEVVSQIHLFGVPEKQLNTFSRLSKDHAVHAYTKSIPIIPGNTGVEKLQLNISLFSESQKHHVYFNRKLYIGSGGEIKNAPECEEVSGYVQQSDLFSIISNPEFQKYWDIKKDKTDVCRDCEYRHMCMDNRVPKQRSSGEWYHEKECDYNPFISKWKEEKGYRTLAESGVKSDAEGFKINRKKLISVNRLLWD